MLKTEHRYTTFLHPVLLPALVVLIFHIFVISLFLYHNNNDLRIFTLMGSTYVNKSQVSSIIKPDQNYSFYTQYGYDGQFVYYIALEPANARYYMDIPSYRYTRILYPITAYVFSLGNANWVPAILLLINLAAMFFGTLYLAKWCKYKGLNPWLSLVYGLYLGQFHSVTLDLTEPLAYSLAIMAIYYLDTRSNRVWLASILFGFSFLTRETTVVFILLYAATFFIRKWREHPEIRWSIVAQPLLILASLIPGLLYQLFLYFWLGSFGLANNAALEKVPLAGLVHMWPWATNTIFVAIFAILPALILFLGSITLLIRGVWKVEVVGLFTNTLFFALCLPPESLTHIHAPDRIMLGAVVSAILCMQYLKVEGKPHLKRSPMGFNWFYVCVVLWEIALLLFVLHYLPFGGFEFQEIT